MISNIDKSNKIIAFSVIVIFLTILLLTLVREGMFMDGLIYSTISRNISVGIGSLWYPKFTETIYPVFNEHPPLVFGIQSVFFDIFGNSIYIERFYSLLTAILTLILIVIIWKTLYKQTDYKNIWWVAVLFWIITPVVFWAYSNNMLECTMGVFTLSAVLLSIKYSKSESNYKYFLLPLISILIVLGVFSKGFPALFPIAVIPIYWLIFRTNKFIHDFISTLIIVLGLIITIIILLQSTNIYNNVEAYINTQVIESISGLRNPGNRMFIVFRLFREISAMFSATILIILLFSKFKIKNVLKFENYKVIIFSILIALSASLPIMISPKQMGFYILQSYPFFAIAFGSVVAPIIYKYLNKMENLLVIKIFAFIVVISFFVVIYFNLGKYSRDESKIKDVKKLSQIIPKNTIVSSNNFFYNDWGFISYLYRYNFISIDRINTKHEYYIASKNKPFTGGDYKKIDLIFNNIDLYKKIQNDKN